LGFGVALIMTSSTALIADYFDEKTRHQFMAKQGMVTGMGGIVFITADGLLAQYHWSYPFAIYLIPLLFFPLLFSTLYEPNRHQKSEETELKTNLLPIYATAFFMMVLFYMLPTQMPYLIVNVFEEEPRMVGFVIATSMVFTALTASQYAKVKEKFSYLQIYAATFVSFAIGVFIISQANCVNHLFYSTIFLGLAFGNLFVNTNAWFLSQVPPSKRGIASGIFTSSLFLGQFCSPLLFEPIVTTYGIQGLFFIISMVSLLVAIVLFTTHFYNHK
jgi:MFS family permease